MQKILISGNKNICIIDLNLNDNVAYIGAISPELFAENEKKQKVELTQEEQQKLSAGKEEYNKAMQYFAKDGDSAYNVEPQDTVAASLVAGELKQSKKDAATSYMNTIRVAAGLGKLSWNEQAYSLAQHKSTLLAYRLKKCGLSIAHWFKKPEGVTDEFYRKALGQNSEGTIVESYAECISGSTFKYKTVDIHIQDDIINYIDDSKNISGLDMGHRNTLLEPRTSNMAMGINDCAGTLQFSGYSNENKIVSAWPANGITFMETLMDESFYWSAKFYDKYYITDTTNVKVTCLNTNEVWSFNKNALGTNQYLLNHVNETFSSSLGNQVVWKDKTLVPEAGDVYKIEISNLKNASTKKLETYIYRTAFEYLDESNYDYEKPINNISIQVPSTIEKNENNIYLIPDAEDTKLTVKINEDAKDRAVKWTSSNPDIIKVTQNGTLTVNKLTNTPITITVCATSDNSVLSKIQVLAYEQKKIPDNYKLKLNYDIYQINNLNETVTLKDEYVPASQITWTSTNENIAVVDNNGRITPKNGGFAYIKATNAKYGTASCWVYVCVLRTLSDGSKAYPGDLTRDGKIDSIDASMAMDWYNKTLTADEIAVGDVNGDGVLNSNDVAEIQSIYNRNIQFKTGEYTPITNITLNKYTIPELRVGSTEQLNAETLPKDTTDSPKVIWQTSNKNVATVDNTGKVTAIGGGSATITAIADNGRGIEATCSVTVPGQPLEIPITKITLDKTSLDFNDINKTSTLIATITPDNTTQSKTITWTTNNPNVAIVDQNGKVTSKGVGIACITAKTSNGKTATCQVNVVVPVIAITQVTLNKTNVTINKGTNYTLTATITPSNTTQSKTITWSSNNDAIATVDSNGKVTGKSAGRAYITAKASNGKMATCVVIVPGSEAYPITKVTLNKTSLNLTKGASSTLTATITPSNTTQSKQVTWTSSNNNVATVSSSGKVTAKSAGTATITVKTSNGKTATCKVTVTNPTVAITKVSLNKTNLNLTKGASNTLTATITPSNTTQSKQVTWTSSNNNVATVSSSGKVTAKNAGTAVITAKTSNGKTATCKVTVTNPIVVITKVTLNKTNLNLTKGATSTLSATITPSNTTQSKQVTWTSSNNNVATVTSSGKVTAKTAGTATITAKTSNGKTATCKITVTNPKPVTIAITKVSLNKTNLNLTKGASSTLTATITPSNTTQNKQVTWTSSNKNVATVTSSGKVTAKTAGTAVITAKTSNGKTATCKVTVTNPIQTNVIPNVTYRTHVQNVGWQNYVKNGAMAGTSGRSLRLEGINIKLENNKYGGAITYQTHVQNIGWQNYVQNGVMSGTSGKSLRLEGIRIKLTGEISKYYDVYYRVHCQNFGWMDWAKNGESAGSAGYAYRLEGIEIRLVKKGGAAPGKTQTPFIQKYVSYQTHVQNVGWQGNVRDGEMSGTSGRSLRLEGIKISLENQQYDGNIEYRTHVQNIGWQKLVKNGQMAGTSGRSLRLEAIQIRLTGTMAQKYDIYYRVHSQNFGWMGWAKNGASAGTSGYSYRLEAIQICIVKKGEKAPGSTTNCFRAK